MFTVVTLTLSFDWFAADGLHKQKSKMHHKETENHAVVHLKEWYCQNSVHV